MKDNNYPIDETDETAKKRLKIRIEKENCKEPQIEERQRIQKDKILDIEEDEEKEEEDEYTTYLKKDT